MHWYELSIILCTQLLESVQELFLVFLVAVFIDFVLCAIYLRKERSKYFDRVENMDLIHANHINKKIHNYY